MNKFTLTWVRSLIRVFISTLILIVAAALPIADASVQEERPFSEAELAQMLAPIALYPDSLLTHILVASTYPLQVVQASRWRTENSHLAATQAVKKAAGKNWEPSVTALLAFPVILNKLSDDLVWTQKLGAAFLEDEAGVLASIQSLRKQADEAGSLSEMEYMSVTRADNQIIIESAQKEIIYVPYYDPLVVYGHWLWYSYPPVYWTGHPYYMPRLHGHFYWSGAVHITFNYYFSTFNWNRRHIIVVNHHNSDHYRHREQIMTSSGAQRWHHKPQYRHLQTDSHFYLNAHRAGRLPAKDEQRSERRPITDSKSKPHNSKQLQRPNQQQIGNHQPQFDKKQRPAAQQQHRPVKIPKQRKNEQIKHNSDKPRQNRDAND